MTGAELIIRRPKSFAFMSVRHDGQNIVEWLKTKPKLTGRVEDIVESWLNFHKPGFGDNLFTKNRKPVKLSYTSAKKAPGDYFHRAMTFITERRLKAFSPQEVDEITCSYGDYQVLIQNGEAYLRDEDQWLPLAQYTAVKAKQDAEAQLAAKTRLEKHKTSPHPHC